MTTVEHALRTAANRVTIVSQGRNYVLHTWSPPHNATWVSHSMDRYRAQNAAYEAKIRIALELLGVEDAGAAAYVAVENQMGAPRREDWRSIVRREAKAARAS